METAALEFAEMAETSQNTNGSINESIDTILSTSGSMYEINDTREAMNRVLSAANMSLIRSQTTTSLQSQSQSGIRRLVAKLKRGVNTFQGKLSDTY